MKRRFLWGMLLAVAVVAASPTPACADGPGPVFGVIASTQGSPPDTAEEHIRQYDRHRANYGGPIGIRIFSGGRLPLPTDNNRPGRLLAWAADGHPEETITVSHKTRDDARLRRLLDWAHVRKLRLSIIYRHEAQPDWFEYGQQGARPDVYRETYRAYRTVIRAHPGRERVTLEKNLMWFWQYHHVRTKPESDWRWYVERNDPADVLSWDTYSFPGMPTRQGHYATPHDFFRYARDAWKEFRLPWGVGEIGTIVQDGDGKGVEQSWDPDGTRFTAWVGRIARAARNPATIDVSYAGMPPARFVKWWGALDADDQDLSLEQVPAAAAVYRGLMRR